MKIEARLESLGHRHSELEAMISQEILHPGSDDLHVHDLKRRKLAIKDEMRELEERKNTQ